jgi:WD40 repeat protein
MQTYPQLRIRTSTNETYPCTQHHLHAQIFGFEFDSRHPRDVRDQIGACYVLLQAHAGQVVAMDAHPTRNECATVGEDGTVRLWDLDTRAPKAFVVLGEEDTDASAIAYSPDGELLALGLSSGSVMFLLTPAGGGDWSGNLQGCVYRDLNHVERRAEVGTQAVCALRYSPDGQLLAAGMRNGRIGVVRIEQEGTGYDLYQVRACMFEVEDRERGVGRRTMKHKMHVVCRMCKHDLVWYDVCKVGT